MMNPWLGCAALCLVAGARAPAQVGAQPKDPRAEVVASILRESLVHGQAYSQLQSLCTAAPKRLSGSAGAVTAVAWAQRQLEADGLENVHLEPCLVPHWERGLLSELSVEAPARAKETRLPILALGGSVGTSREGLSGELIEVRSFEELKQRGESVRGKIVLFNRPMDAGLADTFEAYGGAVNQRGRGAVEAGKLGAVAAVVRSMTTRIDDWPHTGAMRYEDGVPKIPAVAVSTAGAERLSALLKGGEKVRLRLALDCQTLQDVPSSNVVGEIRGSALADEIVLLGGHLDAWDVGQGANDDGAGIVQTMEALRLVKSLSLRPRRTLRVVLFMNEENGLRGALAYRDAHKAEIEKHVLALESDRGGFSPRGFETNANATAMKLLKPISALLEPAGAGMLRAGGGGADTSPLEGEGVVVMEYVPDAARYFDVHHCVRDTLENVHPRELELGAGLIAAMVYCVADMEERLPANERQAQSEAEGSGGSKK